MSNNLLTRCFIITVQRLFHFLTRHTCRCFIRNLEKHLLYKRFRKCNTRVRSIFGYGTILFVNNIMTLEFLRCNSKFITIGGQNYLFVEECNIGLTPVKIKGVKVLSKVETNISVSLTQMEGSLDRDEQELILKPLEKYAQIYILILKIGEDLVVKDQELDFKLIIEMNYYKDKEWINFEFSQNMSKLRIRRPLFSLLAIPKTIPKEQCYEGERFEIIYQLINNLNEFCVSLEWKPELLKNGAQKYADVVCYQPKTIVYKCKPGFVTLITIPFTILSQNVVELVAPMRATLQFTATKIRSNDLKYKRVNSSRYEGDFPIIIYEDKEVDNMRDYTETTTPLTYNSCVNAVKLRIGKTCENSLQVYALNPRICL